LSVVRLDVSILDVIQKVVKSKLLPVHAVWAWRSGVITPFVLILGARWR
jgi:hypothetical protein